MSKENKAKEDYSALILVIACTLMLGLVMRDDFWNWITNLF